jgi:hypothetical protein
VPPAEHRRQRRGSALSQLLYSLGGWRGSVELIFLYDKGGSYVHLRALYEIFNLRGWNIPE